MKISFLYVRPLRQARTSLQWLPSRLWSGQAVLKCFWHPRFLILQRVSQSCDMVQWWASDGAHATSLMELEACILLIKRHACGAFHFSCGWLTLITRDCNWMRVSNGWLLIFCAQRLAEDLSWLVTSVHSCSVPLYLRRDSPNICKSCTSDSGDLILYQSSGHFFLGNEVTEEHALSGDSSHVYVKVDALWRIFVTYFPRFQWETSLMSVTSANSSIWVTAFEHAKRKLLVEQLHTG